MVHKPHLKPSNAKLSSNTFNVASQTPQAPAPWCSQQQPAEPLPPKDCRAREPAPPDTPQQSGLICGSSPLAESVTRSAGIGAAFPGSLPSAPQCVPSPPPQRRVAPAQSSNHRSLRVIRVRRSRRDPPPEIFRRIKVLPDQRRANRLATSSMIEPPAVPETAPCRYPSPPPDTAPR